MKVLIVLACCLAAAAASCGPLQRIQMKEMWTEAYGSTSRQRAQLGEEIWEYIFDKAPEALSLFERVHGDNLHSTEFKAHMLRVFGGLDIAISVLDDEAVLEAELHHLNDQHKARNIPAAYFDVSKHTHYGHSTNFQQTLKRMKYSTVELWIIA